MSQDYLTANYHSHTTRCKHARGSEREYIEAAIAAGLNTLGFSDHVPCPFKDGFVSGIRMPMEQAEEYVTTLRALQQEYADRIRILIGFEAEYMPDYFDEQIALFDKLGIDYMIMGQHFLTSEVVGPYTGTRTESEAFLISYVDRVIAGMQTGRFAYLAHPDLIHYIGSLDIYEQQMRRLCIALKELSIPLEINLLGILEERHYPRDFFWSIAGSVGNDVILGIDAHWPELIGNRSAYHDALALVERHGLHLIHELNLTS